MESENKNISSDSWSERMLKVVQWCNSYDLPGSPKAVCKAFVIDGKQVGILLPDVIEQLKKYPDVFHMVTNSNNQVEKICLASQLKTYEERTEKVNKVLEEFRDQNLFPVALKGWRHENYFVRTSFQEQPLMEMERAATSLFGTIQYGVHINGYCVDPDKGMCMWLARRSQTKQTYPGMLDNVAYTQLPVVTYCVTLKRRDKNLGFDALC
uniref:Nudix hydrolase 20, chloroplastic-like n=1 Tax=Saccoglossus kowalevskii TaxID=10224 RepID=A0ABM0LVE6_SACKO|nr:PREDICTED: nudix hydrolase 20, chloroplastic-like [Saccoglossus kowalevskii]